MPAGHAIFTSVHAEHPDPEQTFHLIDDQALALSEALKPVYRTHARGEAIDASRLGLVHYSPRIIPGDGDGIHPCPDDHPGGRPRRWRRFHPGVHSADCCSPPNREMQGGQESLRPLINDDAGIGAVHRHGRPTHGHGARSVSDVGREDPPALTDALPGAQS